MKDNGTVGPHGEKRTGAEIGVAGVAAEDIPSRRQYNKLQHLVGGEEIILVADQSAGEEQKRDGDNERDNPKSRGRHWFKGPRNNPSPAMGEREGPSPQGWEGEGLLGFENAQNSLDDPVGVA